MWSRLPTKGAHPAAAAPAAASALWAQWGCGHQSGLNWPQATHAHTCTCTHTQEAFKAYERRRNAINDRAQANATKQQQQQQARTKGDWSFWSTPSPSSSGDTARPGQEVRAPPRLCSCVGACLTCRVRCLQRGPNSASRRLSKDTGTEHHPLLPARVPGTTPSTSTAGTEHHPFLVKDPGTEHHPLLPKRVPPPTPSTLCPLQQRQPMTGEERRIANLAAIAARASRLWRQVGGSDPGLQQGSGHEEVMSRTAAARCDSRGALAIT